jgi:nucleoside-diphosphate-sugar epimerase
VWNWIERAKRGDPLVVHGDGTQTVDLVHTADLAKLCKQAAMRDVACANPPAFNVGSGAETPLLDLMAWFREEFPGVRFNVDPKLRPNQHRNFADIRRAQQMIGYVPSIDPRSGIRSVIRWSLQDN